jgi:hypothetical protein
MPGIVAKTKSIGAHDYTVEPHGAIKGRAILLRLAKVVGPALSGVTKDNWGDKLSQLFGNLSEDDLTFFCNEFAAKTMVSTPDGGQLLLSKVFDVHFQDAYLELLQWLGFCVEVNFGGFFRGAAAQIKGSAASPAEAPAKAG